MIRLTEEYQAAAVQVLASSFREEPVFISMFPNPDMIDFFLYGYMEVSVRLAVQYGVAYATSEKVEGVLIGSARMPQAARESLQREWSESMRSKYGNNLFGRIKSICDEMYKVLERNISGDRIYFWMLGVDPPLQRRGYGSTLLGDVLEMIDSTERLPCYLETHSEESVRLYERHGFRVAEDLILPVAHIRHWAMVRPSPSENRAGRTPAS